MKYRKKPVVIEAVQFLGTNDAEVKALCPEALTPAFPAPVLFIETLAGKMAVSPGDWVVKGIEGEFYPCKDSIFQATYEPVSNVAAREPIDLDSQKLTSPTSPQTSQIQEWMADLDALLSRIDASRDYPYRGGHLADCRAAAITHLHEARHWLIADLGHQQAQATDEKFIRAGHKPEDQSCDHAAYTALPQPRPRHCPTCGTCMWDAGD